jgi:hypothetical protein
VLDRHGDGRGQARVGLTADGLERPARQLDPTLVEPGEPVAKRMMEPLPVVGGRASAAARDL